VSLQYATETAQSPDEAQYPFMPQAAIDIGDETLILSLDAIRQELLKLNVQR